jgi:predicted DNA-binding transcriptional regulator YafY
MPHGEPLMARIRFIDRKIRDGRFPNARSLAHEYEVSERTILRDIEYMRNMLDCPIEYDKKRRGFYYAEPAFALPNVSIRESELFALCVAEKALDQYRGTPLYGALASVFKKILSDLPEEMTVHYSWLNPDISFIVQSHTLIKHEIWETISTALYTRALLSIVHRKAGAGEATERIVEPYHMASYEGEWYLIAFCKLRKQILTFALSRIERAENLQETFVRPGSFRLDEYLGDNFGIMKEDKTHDVEIEFSSRASSYIRERIWREGQTIQESPDGGLLLRFKANSLKEVKRWVLGWGPMARVRAPSVLADEIMRDLRTAAENYARE